MKPKNVGVWPDGDAKITSSKEWNDKVRPNNDEKLGV